MSDKLSEYERKRNRKKTPEPFGSKRRGKLPIFVVQRHDARRLHYDFRLERGGVLASWAVPKGVPLEPGQQHLAVHVEDHPLEYATFAGEIPQGNYGAGTVEIWDHGTYELVEEKPDGGLTVRLHGQRLRGMWTLVPAHLSGDEKNWLLLRKRDGSESAARGSYKPMLATLVDKLPTSAGWLFEPKWDGYRALAYVRGGEATLAVPTRQRPDRAVRGHRKGAAERAAHARRGRRRRGLRARRLRSPELLGDAAGQHDGSSTKSSTSSRSTASRCTSLPLTERRERLEQLVVPSGVVQVSGVFDDGDALYEAAKEQGLEGVMAKKAASRYKEGARGGDWLKIKTHGRQEFVICGWTKGQGRRSGTFGSLVLGVREGKEYRWVGNVGTGFNDKTIDELLTKLRPLERATSVFAAPPKMPKIRKGDVVWVEPKLVCEVEFLEWTHDGHLRAPSFQGLRDDKSARAVKREDPQEMDDPGLKLSNLDKLFWPDDDPAGPITKGDLIDYYRAVAPVLVPHLKRRPFTMRRYPDGAYGKAFFQKDAPKHMPEWIPRFAVEVSTRERPPTRRMIEAPLVNDERALLWMANMGCIDMNAWYSRVDKPDRPDFVLFDLDPSPDVGIKEVVEVASIVKQALDALGLVSFPKTSSADGMHVLVPIERRSTYAQTREFCEIVAGALAATHRGLVTTEWSKAKRRGVLIDSNQNGGGKTIASVYSVRPRPGAPVSTPLRWEEVTAKLDPTSFTMDVVLERIRRHGDLFAGVLTTRQRLEPALRSLH